jgi:hypothetical protein
MKMLCREEARHGEATRIAVIEDKFLAICDHCVRNLKWAFDKSEYTVKAIEDATTDELQAAHDRPASSSYGPDGD